MHTDEFGPWYRQYMDLKLDLNHDKLYPEKNLLSCATKIYTCGKQNLTNCLNHTFLFWLEVSIKLCEKEML